MMSGLESILPVDGCLVVPHGAAVSDTIDDMDGHWLSVLRGKVGKQVPVIGTLDPHANVSQLMVASTDALIAYKTNPHVDQRQTGKEAAGLLMRVLNRKVKPVQVLMELPLAISIEQQHTEEDPCKSLYEYALEASRQRGILSVSILLGFPYADVREMGSAIIVVSDNDRNTALASGKLLEQYILDNIKRFVGQRKDILSFLKDIKDRKKPVLLLDMGDNVGGGAPGNSTYLLEYLEREGNCRFFICLYDPDAVLLASKYRKGDIFPVSLGRDHKGQTPFSCNVVLIKMVDGRFAESDPRHGGQVNFDMGQTAIVSTLLGSTIMLTSRRIAPFSLRQLTSFGIMPEHFDVLVAKGVNAPIAAYSGVCPTIMKVDTPGMTQANMTLFNYAKRRKPLFPFENL